MLHSYKFSKKILRFAQDDNKQKKQPDCSDCFSICRDDPTRTDDPYVPNVVR